jgi:hypothetical protein
VGTSKPNDQSWGLKGSPETPMVPFNSFAETIVFDHKAKIKCNG